MSRLNKTLVLALCLGPWGLFAQSERVLPTAPYLGRIPPHTEWTVTVEPKIKQPAAVTPQEIKAQQRRDVWTPPLLSISGVKDEKNIKLVSLWRGDKQTEIYVVDGVVFKSSSSRYPEDIVILDPSSAGVGIEVPKYASADFPELLWVGVENFVETAKEGGVLCHVYESSTRHLLDLLSAMPGLSPEEREAKRDAITRLPTQKVWISAATGLPLKYDDGHNVMRYRFSPGPKIPISYSEPFRKYIDIYRQESQRK